MAVWTNPRTWVPGYIATAAGDFNEEVRDNMTVANQEFLYFRSSGSISTGTAGSRFVPPYPMTIADLWINTEVASTSGSMTFNVLRSTSLNAAATSTSFASLWTSSSNYLTLTSGKLASTAGNAPNVTALTTTSVLLVQCLAAGSSSVKDVSVVVSVSGG